MPQPTTGSQQSGQHRAQQQQSCSFILAAAPTAAARPGGGVTQVELAEFSTAFTGILARVDLEREKGRARLRGAEPGRPVRPAAPPVGVGAATDDDADDAGGGRHTRIALAAVEALFEPAFVALAG